jgi:hypothetical protein
MADSAALLVDDILPHKPMRQWVLSFPFPLRFLFASNPKAMSGVLGIVYRAIATHLAHKAGIAATMAKSGAVTLIQRFGGALNLNIHFHMLLMDGVYFESRPGITPGFRQVKAPTGDELTQLTHTIAHRVGSYLDRRGLLERDTGNCYLTPEAVHVSDEDPSNHLQAGDIHKAVINDPQWQGAL